MSGEGEFELCPDNFLKIEHKRTLLNNIGKKNKYLIKKASFLRLTKQSNWEFTWVNDQL